MPNSIHICPTCQCEMRTYYDQYGYDANCPECGYHEGNLLALDDFSNPIPKPTRILIRFAIQTTSRILYRKNGGRKIHMPTGPRDYIVLDKEIEIPVPAEKTDSEFEAHRFVSDFTWDFDKYLKSLGIHNCSGIGLGKPRFDEVREYTYAVSYEEEGLRADESEEPLMQDEAEKLFEDARRWVESKYKIN